MCIAACLFLFRVLSLSLNRGVGSATPTTGSAWPKRFAQAINVDIPRSVNFMRTSVLNLRRVEDLSDERVIAHSTGKRCLGEVFILSKRGIRIRLDHEHIALR